MPYSPNDEQWREYHVTPRYLAGSTFTGDPALRPLLDARWNLTHDEMGIMWNQICQGSRLFTLVQYPLGRLMMVL
ncbi:hypothetical protein G9272_34125 [Streptomyces asoensis]|uniref:Uncharacterized protein n=1 Tax=Streptomyces asoensis TaxID=249586 RepID=A0A6M4X3B6_9ACTN|nr:hypothetical protein [Streptomyces asoensis]QJT04716.1 hypothetical protein G9272_34125 [Streptomyces asoensis]